MSATAPRRWVRRLAAAATGLAAATSLSLAVGSVVAASHTISTVDFEFQPATLTIVAGDDVRWENRSDRDHTVTADDRSFDSGPFARDEPFSIVFETDGTFAYHCAIHPDTMIGVIVVEAAPPTPASSGTPRPTPPAGTLPPNFSPFPSTGPVETSPPPTLAPTPSPGATPDGAETPASGTDALGMVLIVAALAGVGAGGVVWARRRARS